MALQDETAKSHFVPSVIQRYAFGRSTFWNDQVRRSVIAEAGPTSHIASMRVSFGTISIWPELFKGLTARCFRPGYSNSETLSIAEEGR